MSDYTIRKATIDDIEFLADVVIAAEKGATDVLSYATLFGISEDKAKEFIVSMFDEEIEGCEFSIESFLIVEHNNVPVASFGSWIEGFDGEAPSKIIKSNLINFTFGKDCITTLIANAGVVKEIITEREPMALQFEYLYVSEEYRGKKLSDLLIKTHEENALKIYPELKKAQVQLYKNNVNAIKVYEKNGFSVAAESKSNHPQVLDFLPCDEKYVMEKNY